MSVAVKELIENAIDAKATCITIRFVNFGVEKIEVSDNGSGITADNFEYLCRRHYTSKLESFEDLSEVSTFGFRGEALASLCNICDMIISTRHKSTEIGTEFMVDQGGEIVPNQRRQLARTVGTTITLRHLFKTLPVRRKELINNSKKAFQSALHLIHQYALGMTGIKISCSRKQLAAGVEMNLFTSQGLTVQANIIEIFDYKTYTSLIPIKWDKEALDLESKLTPKALEKLNESKFHLEGFISKPDIGAGKSSKDNQFLYLNNRPCEMPDITKNINRIYRLFNRGQYPFVVLKLQLDEKLIDRNLTPDKRKVMLAEDHVIFKVVQIVLDSMFNREEADVHSLSSSQIMNTFLDTSIDRGISSQSQNTLKRQNSSNSLNSSNDSSFPSEVQNGHSHEFAVPTGPPPRKLIRYEPSVTNDDQAVSPSLSKEYPSEPPRREGSVATFRSIENTSGYGTFETSNQATSTQVMNLSFDDALPDLGNLSGISAINEDDSYPKNNRVENFFIASPSPPRNNHTDDFVIDLPNPPTNNQPEDCFVPPPNPPSNPVSISKVSNNLETFNKQNTDNLQSKAKVQTSLKKHPFFGSLGFPPVGASLPKPDVIPKSFEEFPAMNTVPGVKDQEFSLVEEQIALDVEHFDDEVVKSFDGNGDKDFLAFCDIENGIERNEEEENDEEDSYYCDEQDLEGRDMSTIFFTMEDIEEEYQNMFISDKVVSNDKEFINSIDPENDEDAFQELKMRFSKEDFDNLEVIGQFNLGFIIARTPTNLFIIDQHAVEERRNFENLLSDPKFSTQNLVCHMQMSMSSLNEMIVIDNFDTFSKLGFRFVVNDDERPGKRLKICQIPIGKEWLGSGQDVEEAVAAIRNSPTGQILSNDVSNFVLSGLRREIAYSACRMSIKFGDFLTPTSMTTILGRLSSLRNPFHCAHGRPTLRHLIKIPDKTAMV